MENKTVIGTAEATIDSVRTTKDGGYKVTFEIGYDSLHLAQQLLKEVPHNSLVYLTVIKENENI